MIVTELKHLPSHDRMTPEFQKAVAFLRSRDLLGLPDGRIDIDGKRVFALVQRYETTSAERPRFERHEAYIDVQYVAVGEEIIGWVPAERMTVIQPYDENADICFGEAANGTWTPVLMTAGIAAVFYPEDGHAPKIAHTSPSRVVKIVVKVAVPSGRRTAS
jgi:biofilm protein TabA